MHNETLIHTYIPILIHEEVQSPPSTQNVADRTASVAADACQVYAIKQNIKKSTSQYMCIKYYNENLGRQRPSGNKMEWKQRLSNCQSQEQSAHRWEGSEPWLGWC